MATSVSNLVNYTQQAFFCGKPTWSPSQIPDLSGRIVIVTGGNAGLGKVTVQHLLEHNAKVYMASRSESKAKEAIEKLKALTGKEAIFLKLDLTDLSSVKAAATDFLTKERGLHILYNNGGVMMSPVEKTVNGYDLQFATNVLGHFYFTKLLLPTIISTAQTSKEPPRIINLSSSAIYLLSGGFNFELLTEGPKRLKAGTNKLYMQSKLGNILFSNELARRYGSQGIVSIAVNPGNINTDLGKHTSGPTGLFLQIVQRYPPEWGALTQLYAGCAPKASELNGKYLKPWAQLGEATSEAKDKQLAKSVWEWLEEQVKKVDPAL